MKLSLDNPKHAEFVAALEDLAVYMDGEIRTGYGGRDMYGRVCYGIVVDDDVDALMEWGRMQMPQRPERDSMGMNTILYWPDVEGKRT